MELPRRSSRGLLPGVRAKLTLVKFLHPPGGWRKRFTPMQWTGNGTANITDNLDVTFSSLLTVNLLWRSAAPWAARNAPQNLTNVNFARTRESLAHGLHGGCQLEHCYADSTSVASAFPLSRFRCRGSST